MTDKKGNNIILPCTKPAESTENADGVKPAYFRKSETVRGKKRRLFIRATTNGGICFNQYRRNSAIFILYHKSENAINAKQ